MDLYTNCLFLLIANIILVFLINLQNKKHKGIVDLVFFDGASNVQNAGKILQARHPRITVGHGAEHVVSLFFADVFTKIPAFEVLANFAKKLRNVFGSTRHVLTAIFNNYSKKHNKGIRVGLIKPSDCRMAGHQIALLRILRLKDAFQATVTSTEFKELKMFNPISYVLLQEEFWKYLFVMCRALYAPMRLLRLADQKIPAMDKLIFYVHQSERMIEKWIKVAEEKHNDLGAGLLDILKDTEDVASQVLESDVEDSDDDREEEVSWLRIFFHSTTNEQIT